jgi:hypothetical protein
MLNLTGPEFDLGNVVHAVLAHCEHRRPAISGDFQQEMRATAERKLADVRSAYDEARGDSAYWETLQHEVLDTALPQYLAIAERQSRLERTTYDVWRGGDIAARATFALIGLVIGAAIVEVPFIPIYIDAFAFFLAFCGWFYPDLKKVTHDYGYNRRLNAIVAEATRYQQRTATAYLTTSSLDRALSDGTPQRDHRESTTQQP